MDLEGCLYVGTALCSLCGFSIFWVRVVFSMNACCLFPQCVLSIIPLIECVQMQLLAFSLRVTPSAHSQSSQRQLAHAPGTCDPLSGSRQFLELTRSDWCLLLELMKPVSYCFGVHVQGKRLLWQVPPLPSHALNNGTSPLWWVQAFSAYTVGCSRTRIQPLQAVSAQPTLVLSPDWPSEA